MKLTAADIRALRADDPKSRERDFAEKHKLSEAQLLAAYTGHGVTRIKSDIDKLMAVAEGLGEVMALTRNASCVHEKVGRYGNYRGGGHAAMVFNREIDLRMFPSHWQHAFMVEKQLDNGMRRSIQVFDAAGDAVHKIFLRESSDLNVWKSAQVALSTDVQSPELSVEPRVPTEPAKYAPENVENLRERWSRMTDSHQFMMFSKKLGMNRLGAYRCVGEPWTRRLRPEAINQALTLAAQDGIQVMVFVGNRGCIQIHSGPVQNLRSMGPWQNVLDPGFDLHLRLDHIAEVWSATKPSAKGDVVSVEAFDKDGMLIAMMFGTGPEWDVNDRPRWDAMVAELPGLQEEMA
ncbi:Hemin transport protein HmuS [Candidatus Rhodobacter oscarellae]|uniref:Hemin transport protein HmuS n=1 Tax=Candidatus Rhodobacter oscarellae TaxID=1675527 RepID=A0A0J9E4Q4_9RHOB|nr:hemin-degrading factor [Candidatus Rhodobacter lobularis]KMW57726.1 Hemin transport protein HmuS [Candidatus Rhodobacter lobularis]